MSLLSVVTLDRAWNLATGRVCFRYHASVLSDPTYG